MSKETAKKATFKDLIAAKIQREQDKFQTKDIYVSGIDKTLTFEKPSEELTLDTIDAIGEGQDTKMMLEAFDKLIYQCCPMFQDVELQKELEVKNPFDIVKSIMDMVDRMQLGEELIDWVGINERAEKIKN